jgi:hypothetical protein
MTFMCQLFRNLGASLWNPQGLSQTAEFFFNPLLCAPLGTLQLPTSRFFPYSLYLFYHLQDGTKFLMLHFQSHTIGTMISQTIWCTITFLYNACAHLDTVSWQIECAGHMPWTWHLYILISFAEGVMYVMLIPTTFHELQQHIIETFIYVARTGIISLSGHL